MSRRLKPYAFIILTTLIIALLLGPPLSLATKLPTVCNIFYKKTIDKAGPCGHRVMVSKIQDNSFEVGAVLLSNVDFENRHFITAKSSYPTLYLLINNLSQANPLRC